VKAFVLVAIVAGLAAGVTAVAATATAGPDRAEARPLPGLPAYTAGFERWVKLNRRPIPPRRVDAHRGTKNVYVSRSRVGARYPYGTVVVKTIRRPGQRFVSVIAVMRKARGANRRHNDWVMIEYDRSSTRDRFRAFASGAICTGCHMQVRGRDYVFTRRAR
jgi:Cytochrome P460